MSKYKGQNYKKTQKHIKYGYKKGIGFLDRYNILSNFL